MDELLDKMRHPKFCLSWRLRTSTTTQKHKWLKRKIWFTASTPKFQFCIHFLIKSVNKKTICPFMSAWGLNVGTCLLHQDYRPARKKTVSRLSVCLFADGITNSKDIVSQILILNTVQLEIMNSFKNNQSFVFIKICNIQKHIVHFSNIVCFLGIISSNLNLFRLKRLEIHYSLLFVLISNYLH